MRCTVPTKVPASEKILKLYDAGRSGGAGITGRPWPGSLQTIRGAPGSLKQVQPAFINVLGVKPSAVAAVAVASETATAVIKSASLIIVFSFRRNPADRRRSNSELPAALRVNCYAPGEEAPQVNKVSRGRAAPDEDNRPASRPPDVQAAWVLTPTVVTQLAIRCHMGARRSCSTDGQPAPASRSVTSNSFRCPAGTEQTCKSRGSHGRGLLLLDEQPLAFEEILERAGALSKNTVRRRLGELVQQGLAERLSDGKRSDPYRWKLSEAGRTFLPTSETGLARNAGDPPVQA